MKRILIVKFWAFGDILMATPLLRALKTQWPDCHIAWLVDADFADVLRGNPMVNEVIAFPSGDWRRDWRYGRVWPYLKRSLALRRQLKAGQYDILLSLTAEKWWAAWFLTAPVRIGLFPRARPGWMGKLYTTAIPRTYHPVLHNTRHYLLPADALGIPGPHSEQMVLGVRDEDRHHADAFLAAQPAFDPTRPLYVLHPGTSQASKCWLPEHYAAVAAELTARGANVVLTGSPAEAALCERIAEQAHARRKDHLPRPSVRSSLQATPPEAGREVTPPPANMTSPAQVIINPPSVAGGVARGSASDGVGGLLPPVVLIAAGHLPSLLSAAALVERAAAVVTGDTSLLHIASALGVPLVGVYGSTRPNDNAPLFGPQVLLFDNNVPCAPCYKAHCPLTGDAHLQCQRAVTPQMVLATLDGLT